MNYRRMRALIVELMTFEHMTSRADLKSKMADVVNLFGFERPLCFTVAVFSLY